MVCRLRPLVALVATSGLLLIGAAVANADYGFPVPPGPPVPGGFKIVIASKTIGPRGGTLPGKYGATRFRLLIPRASLVRRIQFTLTRPYLPGVRHALPRSLRLRVAVGLLANHPSGQPIKGWFSRKGAELVVLNRRITAGDKVLSWNARHHRFERIWVAHVARGRVVVKLRHFAEIAIVD